MISRSATILLVIMYTTVIPAMAQDPDTNLTDRFVDPPPVKVNPGEVPDNIPRLWKDSIPRNDMVRVIVQAISSARENAISRLQKRLVSAHIGDGKKISDFIKASDNPGVDLKSFLNGADEAGIRLREDMLVCEVEIRTNLRTAIACFKGWADKHVKHDKIDLTLLNRYVETIQYDISKEIGTSAVDTKAVSGEMAVTHEKVRKTVLNPPVWIADHIITSGSSNLNTRAIDRTAEKQRAYAEAEKQARTRLQKKVYAMKLTADLTVGEFIEKNDKAGKVIRTFCENAPEIKAARRIMNQKAQFAVSLNMKTLWNMFVYYSLRQN